MNFIISTFAFMCYNAYKQLSEILQILIKQVMLWSLFLSKRFLLTTVK